MEHQYKQHYAAMAVATVTKMIESKVFGPDGLFVSFILDEWHTKQNHFCSVVLYGTITVSDRDCCNHRYQLVLKFKHPEPEKREFCRNNQQFHNEILFYEQIAPFLLAIGSQKDGNCPTTPSLCRYFYGHNYCGDLSDRDLIVLENVTVRGYQSAVTVQPFIMDFDHLALAIRTLAKFHSLSFRAKHMYRDQFMELVAKVKETQFNTDGKWYQSSKVLGGLLTAAFDRLVEVKGDSGRYDQKAQQFRTELSVDALKMLKCVMKSDEPLSVLCHGDFGCHNLLFRYDDDGRPLDALVYDMAAIRYGSPALDLSYFMYLNTDRQTREDHWDELLDIYCETLASVTGSALVPDRSQLDAEMRKYAYYGLAIVLFVLRIVFNPFDLSKLTIFTDDEALHFLLSRGGKCATERSVDAVQHYLDMVYTNKVVDGTTSYKTPVGGLPSTWPGY